MSRFFDSSEALLAVLDAEGRFLRTSPSWESVLGYLEAELRGRPALEFVYPPDREKWTGTAATESSAEPVGLRWRARDGGIRWLSWSCVRCLDDGVSLCVGQDVSSWVQRWGAGPSLRGAPPPAVKDREQPAREIACAVCDFTRFFQLSQDVMAIADAEGRITSANAAWRAVLGYSPRALVGRTLLELAHESDRGALQDYWRQILRDRRGGELTVRLNTASGEGRTIRWRAALDPHLGVVHLVGRDQGEVLRAREEEEQIRSIMESVPHPIFSLDAELRISQLNDAASVAFGYDRHEFVGQSIDWLVPGLSGMIEAAPEHRFTVGEQGATFAFELSGVRKGGLGFPLRASVTEGSRRSGRQLTVLIRDLSQERLDRARSLDEARALEASAIHVRLANELHDGLLQSLTGASLQLEVIRRLLASDAGRAEDRLAALQTSLLEEQRELRFFVDEFKSGGEGWGSHDAPIHARLRRLLGRVEQIWEVACPLVARVEVEPTIAHAHEVLRIIHEAVVNAVRHGRAARVSVTLECREGETVIRIDDDGSGFPFQGHWDHERLVRQLIGPRRLKQRVIDNGGRIEIDSSRAGGIVTVRIPVEVDR